MKIKNSITKIIFAALMLFSFNSIFGQAHLAVTGLTGWRDTANCDSSYSNTYVTIKNVDTTASYVGSVTVLMQVDTFPVFDTLLNNVSVYIGRDSSQPYLAIPYSFTAQMAGHDVVIVWPIAIGVPHLDTLHDSMFVICTAGIPDIPKNKSISFFPNPANNMLHFDSKYSLNSFEYFRILDVVGEELSRFIPSNNSIPINNLSPGMYFIEVKLKDGSV